MIFLVAYLNIFCYNLQKYYSKVIVYKSIIHLNLEIIIKYNYINEDNKLNNYRNETLLY